MSDNILDLTKTDLIHYFPEFLRDTGEYIALCNAINPELDRIKEEIQRIDRNIIPETADEHGITMMEQWLGIITNPTLDLDERRAAVIAKFNETLPYTEIRLQRMLAAIVGWGHFHYERHGAYVKVLIDPESSMSTKAVGDMLERVLPMNLHFEVVLRCVESVALIDFAVACIPTAVIDTPLNTDFQTSHVFHSSPYLESAVIITNLGE